jgi:hypothetical protein
MKFPLSNISVDEQLKDFSLLATYSLQLALLLHQQLNSSPRVPRVPRGHQTGSMQMLHQTGASVFSKRSSAHGGKDQTPVSSPVLNVVNVCFFLIFFHLC